MAGKGEGVIMKIELQQKDTQVHKWHVVARFEYGAHAMEAGRALSEADGRLYRVVDHRWPHETPMVILYEDGKAS
jgi:hypothetical protein